MYASRTGTRTTLDRLRAHGWRLLMSPVTLKDCKGKQAQRWADGTAAPYALDNGAWGCHQQGRPFALLQLRLQLLIHLIRLLIHFHFPNQHQIFQLE